MSARAIEAGRAIVRIAVDDSAVAKGLRDMEARFRATSATLSSMGTSLIASGAALGGMMVLPLKYAANLEKTSVAFQSIIGDADKAAVALRDIKELAASTPFQFTELASAGQKLLAFGTASDAVAGELRRIGDVSAAIGAPIGEVAEIYGKARVQGRLFAEDINQLTGRGIPIIGELAKQFGVTEQEVKKLVESGQVSFANLETAMISMTSEGGFAFQMMERQSQTFLGRLSTLVDNAMEAILPIGTELLAVIGPALDTVGQMIQSFGSTLASTEGLASSLLSTAAIAVGLGVSMVALSKAIAGVEMVMKVARATAATLSVAYGILRTAAIASLVAWVAVQAAMWATVVATTAATLIVKRFGVVATITKTATLAWAAAQKVAAITMALMRNGVLIGTVAIGLFTAATSAASAATAIMQGRFIASAIAIRGFAAGSAMAAGAIASTTAATSMMGAIQPVVASAIGLVNAALFGTSAAGAVSVMSAITTSAAWTTAAGVISAAYAIITSPITLIVGGIIAIGAAITVAAGAFAAWSVGTEVLGDAFSYIMRVAGPIINVVKQVAAGLKEALSAGQYMIAAKMLWAGLQQVFWIGVREVVNAFRTLPGYIWDITKKFASTFVSTLWNLFTSIPDLMMRALRGESIGDAIGAILSTGDWLEGLATDRITQASSDIAGLRNQLVQLSAAQQAVNDQTAEYRKLGLDKRDANSEAVNPITGEPEPKRELTIDEKVSQFTAAGDKTSEEVAAFRAREQEIAAEKARRQQAKDAADAARTDAITGSATEGGSAVVTVDADLTEAQKKMKALADEIRELQLGADAAADAELAAMMEKEGKTQEQISADLAAIQALRERKRALEAEKDATEKASAAILDRLDKQASELAEQDIAPEKIYERQVEVIDQAVADGKVTPEQAVEAKTKAAEDRDDRIESRKDEGRRMAEELRTPLEKFNAEQQRILNKRQRGEIDDTTAARAMARAREEFGRESGITAGANPASQRPELGQARFGSKEAFDTLARTRGIGGDGARAEVPAWVAPMTQAAQAQAMVAAGLPAQMAAALAATTQKAIDTKRLEDLTAKQLIEQSTSTTLLRQIATNTAASDGGDL